MPSLTLWTQYMPILLSVGIVAVLLGASAIRLGRRARTAGALLDRRLWEQGWKVTRRDMRWLRRGPYFFATNKGVVFRLQAQDGVGTVFNGFASVSAGWDDFHTERIEILWDAVHASQPFSLHKPEAAPGGHAADAGP